MQKQADFTAFAHPVLAVACPACGRRAGERCDIQRIHWSRDFHLERKQLAGQVFLTQHGEEASISRVGGIWKLDPRGNAHPAGPEGETAASPG